MNEWRSTATMTRRHLWRGEPIPGALMSKTRCNGSTVYATSLQLDSHKPRCQNCTRLKR